MNWTKAQHVEHGTWWDGPGDPPQSVLDARQKYGFNPDGSPVSESEKAERRNTSDDIVETSPSSEDEVDPTSSTPEGDEQRETEPTPQPDENGTQLLMSVPLADEE